MTSNSGDLAAERYRRVAVSIDRRTDCPLGYAVLADTHGIEDAQPSLQAPVECDVVIICAGITGVLIANELTSQGRSVVIVDQRDRGLGSTSASTALLQYEIDTHLTDLADMIGWDGACRACRAGVESLQRLGSPTSELESRRELRATAEPVSGKRSRRRGQIAGGVRRSSACWSGCRMAGCQSIASAIRLPAIGCHSIGRGCADGPLSICASLAGESSVVVHRSMRVRRFAACDNLRTGFACTPAVRSRSRQHMPLSVAAISRCGFCRSKWRRCTARMHSSPSRWQQQHMPSLLMKRWLADFKRPPQHAVATPQASTWRA